MAFSFGNPGIGALGGGNGGNAESAQELEDIQTQAVGFLALAGESKIQLLPSPWPIDNLPPPTSSLMGIASHRGLIAAAGPDGIIVATTESVRKAFEGPGNKFKPFEPQLKIPMPMRVSQLAFTADDSYLILSAETGGGLAVYEVDALLNGSTQTAFELSTNGEALRALVPNPTREKGELLAVVTTEGNLMMANLKDRTFRPGPNGQVLRTGVSCVSWSTKGKQLVAGLGDGTACQMTPEGELKGQIPKPPQLGNDNCYVSSLTWLENNVFLLIHTPHAYDNSMAPNSNFHLATRQAPPKFKFQKLNDPAPPFGLNRSPPHHFLLRLKDFPPNIQDLLVVGSTASTDINLFTRSSAPLTNDKPADKITGVFTMTEMADDSRRAQLPGTSGGDFGDTSPIGFALDLSSRTKVWKPIPGDDQIDESPQPVPALMVLNNEGILASWWVIYSDSVRQGTIYPGLVVAEGMTPPQQQQQPPPSKVSAFGAPGGQSFGNQPSSGSVFGAPKPLGAPGAFGSPSAIGQKQSPWGGQPLGTPSFGTPSLSTASNTAGATFGAAGAGGATAFGTPGLPGIGRPSVWGSANQSTSSGTAFGQASALGGTQPVFGSSTSVSGNQPQTTKPPGSGFAGFANQGGFANAAPSTGQSIFGSKPATSSGMGAFGSTSSEGGVFGSNNAGAGTAFGGANKTEQNASPFGGNGFSLGTTFKADTSIETEPKNASAAPSSFFGGGFGNALADAGKAPGVQTPVSKEADMDTEDNAEPAQPSIAQSAMTTPAPTKPSLFSPAPTAGPGIFGAPSVSKPFQSSSPSLTVEPSNTGGTPSYSGATQTKSSPFSLGSTEVKPAPNPFAAAPVAKAAGATSPVKIKQEPSSDNETSSASAKMPHAPLPPEPTSARSFPVGETSDHGSENENEREENDAPLPPDFAPKPKPAPLTRNDTDAPLPPDFAPKPKPKSTPTPPAEKGKPQNQPSLPASPIDNVPEGPHDEGDGSDFVTEDEGDGQSKEPSDEGSGEDLGKPDSPTAELNLTPGLTPQSSFEGKKRDTSPFAKVQKPPQPLGQSRGLFGEISATAPVLPPPKGPLQPPSPRSPSPVRSAIPPRMMRPDTSRSVSAPSDALRLLNAQKVPVKPAALSQSTFMTSIQQEKSQEQRRTEAKAKKEAEETRNLVDDEDERMQKYLAEDIEATTTLDEFIGHSDIKRLESIDSIPASVEILYRDINSMIDTLGVNAKALKSFIKGHTEQYKEDRGREDLEDDESWCLDEIDALSHIVEKELGRELEMGRIQDPPGKIETCEELQKNIIRLQQKHDDVKRIVVSHTHPDHTAIARAQPLNAEQAAQQNDLRRGYFEFQKLLSEAEEALTILRAKLASQNSNGNSKTPAPTVEAIMRTIAKMTSMAEQRSGDVDVLEGQMRKLRLGTTSREGSPALRTPQKNANRMSMRAQTPGTASTTRMFYTPESNFRGSASRRIGGSTFMMSGGASVYGSPSPRKKISGYTGEEKAALSEKGRRKLHIKEQLKSAVVKAKMGVKPMEEDDGY